MAWYRRLRNMARSERLSAELNRELEFHLAERIDELVAEGMSEEEARREARLRFGNPTVQKERTRDHNILPWLESLLADLRYALRSLRASPGFAVVAILSLGLAIGANTAIFSLIDAVMLRSLPVEDPEELVRVTTPTRAGGLGEGSDNFTNPLWEALRDRQDVFSGTFATADERFDLSDGGESRPVAGAWVSGGFFSTLGVHPAAGRLVVPADDYRGCPPVAVVSHGFWQSAHGGSPQVVGRTLSLNGHSFEIIGVAGASFSGIQVGRATEVYVPLCTMPILQGGSDALEDRSTWFLYVFGRLRPGVTAEDAGRRLAALAPALTGATVPEDWPAEAQADYRRTTLTAVPAANGYSGVSQYNRALVALMAAVGLILLIGCANVANLLLARAASRRHEVAVRLALGAGRGRLVRQLLTESLLLSLLGGAVGLLLAGAASRFLVRYMTTGVMRGEAVWLDLSIDGRVLAFTLLVATGTAVLFGLVPAWRFARVDPRSAMRTGERSIVEGSSRFGTGKALVVGQIALSLILVVGAGLLLGTFRRLATMDPGFEPAGVLLASVDIGDADIPEEQIPGVRREILERLRATPGVEAASASAFTPLSGVRINSEVEVEGYTPTNPRDASVFFNWLSDGFFSTLGTPLLAGRDFAESDVAGSDPVMIVNEAFVQKFFHGADPVGQRVTVKGRLSADDDQSLLVVGVVRDMAYHSMRDTGGPLAFVPLSQLDNPAMPLLELELRGRGEGSSLIRTVTEVVGEVNGAFSIRYETMAAQMDASLARERLLATLSGLFGLLALLLAVVGLYGTMAYSVAQRRGEIGIRIALGAARERVMGLVLGDAGRLLLAGLLLGAVGALLATRWMESFLFGLAPSDPLTWAASAMTLALAAAGASALPAWRAARMDANAVLRAE